MAHSPNSRVAGSTSLRVCHHPDRKVLADLAVTDSATFSSIVEQAKADHHQAVPTHQVPRACEVIRPEVFRQIAERPEVVGRK